MEVRGVDKVGQEMVSNKKSPRKASKKHKHLRYRLRIIFFQQRKPEEAREMEKEPEDSGPKEESFKKE